jgi:TonB family protein
MKKTFLFILLVLFSTFGIAQDTLQTPLEFVQERPTYPGGEDAMFQVIFDHLVYPEYEKSMNIEGTVLIQFIIEKDGTPTNFKVFRGVPNGSGLDSAALMACKQLGRFNPGKQDGIPQRVYSGMPIKFSLADDEEPAEERLSKADLKEIKKDAKYICDMMSQIEEARRANDKVRIDRLTAEFEAVAAVLQKKYPKDGVKEDQLEDLVKPCLEEARKAASGK